MFVNCLLDICIILIVKEEERKKEQILKKEKRQLPIYMLQTFMNPPYSAIGSFARAITISRAIEHSVLIRRMSSLKKKGTKCHTSSPKGKFMLSKMEGSVGVCFHIIH